MAVTRRSPKPLFRQRHRVTFLDVERPPSFVLASDSERVCFRVHLEPTVDGLFPLGDVISAEGAHVRLGENESALADREYVSWMRASARSNVSAIAFATSAAC